MENVNQEVTIQDVESIVCSLFPDYWKPTEACLATVATLLLEKNANPTSLILVGPPSSGKTTVLDFFTNKEIIYRCDSFTSRAFVSGYAKKTREALEKDVDLISRFEKKCFIVPDFGVFFGKRKDDRSETLGILTRLLDGHGLVFADGVQGERKHTGDVMFSMLCATTPFGYHLWDVMGRFGSRLLFLQMPEIEHSHGIGQSDDDIQSVIGEIPYSDKKSKCQEVINKFLATLWEQKGGFRKVCWNNNEIPPDAMKIISGLAKLLSRLRGMIQIWRGQNDEYEHKRPIIENHRRVMFLLLNIAKGKAIINGRTQIGMEDIPLLIDITLGSCPEDRGKIFKSMLKKSDYSLTTSEVCGILDVTSKTALMVMENMKILKLADYQDISEGRGQPEKQITLPDEIVNFIVENKITELIYQI